MVLLKDTHPKLTKKLKKLFKSIPLDKDNSSVKDIKKDNAIETMFYMGLIALPIYFDNKKFKN